MFNNALDNYCDAVHSYDEYSRLDGRNEIIDGVVYAMSTPNNEHQEVVGEALTQLKLFFRDKQCRPGISPVDVEVLSDDGYCIIQPDVYILCDGSKRVGRTGRIIGSPEWIMEVISPSTKGRDCLDKLLLYMRNGCKEYWIVEPGIRKVIIYEFSDGRVASMDLVEAALVKSPQFGFEIDFAVVWKYFDGLNREKHV
jgi:Uma2 family endonuclease